MKLRKLVLILSAALVLPNMTAEAVTVSWDDLTDAQQESAYYRLESENESLKRQVADLQGQAPQGAGDGTGEGAEGETAAEGQQGGTESSAAAGQQGGTESSAAEGQQGGTESSAAAGQQSGTADTGEAAASSQILDTDTFLRDIGASFAARQKLAAAYTADQIAAMSQSELWDYRFGCAEAERDFYDAYRDAQFSSMNLIYLCGEYVGGLGKQFQAEEIWNSSQDAEKCSQLYTAGYYNRAYALVELHDYYGLNLADGYDTLKAAVSRADEAAGEETRNKDADSAAVKRTQELLNQLGFLCGPADGIAGRQTTSCVVRFQTMYGFDPADGLIDEELISQMERILSQQQG